MSAQTYAHVYRGSLKEHDPSLPNRRLATRPSREYKQGNMLRRPQRVVYSRAAYARACPAHASCGVWPFLFPHSFEKVCRSKIRAVWEKGASRERERERDANYSRLWGERVSGHTQRGILSLSLSLSLQRARGAGGPELRRGPHHALHAMPPAKERKKRRKKSAPSRETKRSLDTCLK